MAIYNPYWLRNLISETAHFDTDFGRRESTALFYARSANFKWSQFSAGMLLNRGNRNLAVTGLDEWECVLCWSALVSAAEIISKYQNKLRSVGAVRVACRDLTVKNMREGLLTPPADGTELRLERILDVKLDNTGVGQC